MTDTPDALIAHLLDTYQYGGDVTGPTLALRAHLLAGDAAIKRVARLDALVDDLCCLLDAKRDDETIRNVRAEKAEADLAAARAEIEELKEKARRCAVASLVWEQRYRNAVKDWSQAEASRMETHVQLEDAERELSLNEPPLCLCGKPAVANAFIGGWRCEDCSKATAALAPKE